MFEDQVQSTIGGNNHLSFFKDFVYICLFDIWVPPLIMLTCSVFTHKQKDSLSFYVIKVQIKFPNKCLVLKQERKQWMNLPKCFYVEIESAFLID